MRNGTNMPILAQKLKFIYENNGHISKQVMTKISPAKIHRGNSIISAYFSIYHAVPVTPSRVSS